MTDPGSVTEALIAAVREARDRDGWNARTLAQACAAAGMPSLDQSTITNILNNRRQRIGVDEWLTLAYVLNLPPAQMLLPLTSSDRARLTPGVVVDQEAALRWLLGQTSAPRPDSDLEHELRWARNGAPLLGWQELWQLTGYAKGLLREREAAASRPLPDEGKYLEMLLKVHQNELEAIDRRLRTALLTLTEHYDRMHEQQLSPPACEPMLLDEMDRLEVPRPKGMSK